MKTDKVVRIVVVESGTATDFQDEMNTALKDIDSPEIQIDTNKPYLAYIFYKLDKQRAETLEDKFSLQGISYKCAQCIHLEKPTDRRKKSSYCMLFQRDVRIDGSACEMLYRELIEGVDVLTNTNRLLDLTEEEKRERKNELAKRSRQARKDKRINDIE